MDEEQLAELFEEYYEEDNSEGLHIVDLQSPIENTEPSNNGYSKSW